VAVATDSPVLEKLISNIQEVRARGARVIGIATEGNLEIGQHCDEVVRVPSTHWLLNPLLAVVPLQLLAYFIATRRGLNVDQPRNSPRPSPSSDAGRSLMGLPAWLQPLPDAAQAASPRQLGRSSSTGSQPRR